jgi:hypothetical protein
MKRNLKIEERGDRACGKIFPGIRLIGKWLERAGFPPGRRVVVTSTKTGTLTIEVQP